MRGGAYGRLLHVDLSSRTARVEEPDASLFCRFLGGRGLAGALLRPHVSRSWDDPELPLAILTGALSGTAAPGSNRACIASRSPLTSTFLDSAVGGGLASAIKHAGLDGIVIRGASENLVGLRIVGGAVEFLDAAHLAGRSTADVYTDVLGDAPADPPAFTAIGPAGEAGVAVANIIVDRHFPTGRGLGAVMGAKKLKWLAVRGTGAVPVVDAAGLEAARAKILRLTAASPFLQGQFGISNYGTAALFDLAHSRRMLPTDNFRRTWFDHQGALSAPVLVQRYKAQNSGCAGCHIHCARIAQSELGGEVGWPLPEFDALSHLSALIGNADPDLAVRLNLRCIALGLDPLSTGGVLATRREIMSGNDAPAELLNLLDDIAHGRGEGEILGQGAYRYADAMGRPEAAMTVKGMELPALDPRGAYGLALGYAVATRGGCYLRAFPISHEILRKPVATDRFSFAAKARMIKIAEDVIAAADSLGVCTFMLLAAGLEEYGAAMAAVTGEPWEQGDLMRIGERIVYQERCMLREAGCGPESDDLPARFFHEAGSETETQTIPALDRDAFLKARGAYYSVRGLDEAGNPLPEKAEALGLECPKVGPVSERLDDARR
ncbi:aldehyde ferredoxin oxidoreductase [Oceanidesulfovibrio indonesiensis]|uniref:Aldehyde ferredoxin oxidoreductase n=1 Tax=Oceanidesulfovibrio indonesiensis TaxID=54767 RepID=A0A7M3MET9_9BACT|nr:aldehyde ferredoxin oxidoreductase C-terminal domain-containing protein [Oceanidesulfovibrio indonesiensis]TVM17072.1 aldehyde ferredoxin oxidoreductase [Oceanidesulfovibrio indonesiensis]